MELRLVRKGVWTVYAVCDDRGDCELADFLASQDRGAAMLALLDYVAGNPQGPRLLPDEVCHQVAPDIWQFSKGRPGIRVLWFYDEGKLVVCTHGFAKGSKKTPKAERDKALGLRERYFADKKAGQLRYSDPTSAGPKGGG